MMPAGTESGFLLKSMLSMGPPRHVPDVLMGPPNWPSPVIITWHNPEHQFGWHVSVMPAEDCHKHAARHACITPGGRRAGAGCCVSPWRPNLVSTPPRSAGAILTKFSQRRTLEMMGKAEGKQILQRENRPMGGLAGEGWSTDLAFMLDPKP